MAGVLVHIEADGLEPTEASLRLLGEGRRIATTLGATLYAHVQLAEGEANLEDLATRLGHAGADRAIVSRVPEWRGPVMWTTHGPSLARACSETRPLLVLLAGGASGAELGPRLAASLSAAFLPEPDVERGSRGELVFSRSVFGSHQRRLSAHDLERPLVVTLPARSLKTERGSASAALRTPEPAAAMNAEPEPTDGKPATATGSITYKGARADAGAALEDARIVVFAGSGVTSFETYGLIEALAEALGGVVAATHTLCAKGIAPPELEVGVGARAVAPDLLVICGASGSSASLGAISGSPDIIAIDRNPDAAVFRIAAYGLVGELELVLPELIRELKESPAEAAPS